MWKLVLALLALVPLVGCNGSHPEGPGASPPLAFDDGQLAPDLVDVLEHPDAVTLVAVDPDRPRTEVPEGTERIGSWRVLGRAEVDLDTGRRVLAHVADGMRRNREMIAACFNPRHAVVVRRAEREVTLLICFECLSLRVYEGGDHVGGGLTTEAVEPAVSTLFREQGLTIAPSY